MYAGELTMNILEQPPYGFYSSVQVLRAIAASMVVIFHLPAYIGYEDVFIPVLHGGVDLFFVISGFVMMVSTTDKRHDPVSFLKKRFMRIVPLYWLGTIAMLVIWHV